MAHRHARGWLCGGFPAVLARRTDGATAHAWLLRRKAPDESGDRVAHAAPALCAMVPRAIGWLPKVTVRYVGQADRHGSDNRSAVLAQQQAIGTSFAAARAARAVFR